MLRVPAIRQLSWAKQAVCPVVLCAVFVLVASGCSGVPLGGQTQDPLVTDASLASASMEVAPDSPRAVDSESEAESAYESKTVSPKSRDPHLVAEAARSALDAASGSDEINVFDTVTGSERVLEDGEAPDVQRAVAAFHDKGYDVGFVVYDLMSQRGMGYNADAAFFSASAIKAPFVAYVTQNEVDTASALFENELFEDIIVDGTGIMAYDDKDSYSLKEVLTNTILYSDNTGYALLRERFDQGEFEEWCAKAGVDAWAWEGEWYPPCTARDLSKLWLYVGAYALADEGNASWCKSLLLQTEPSFLREALGKRGSILSKPGFEIDSDYWGALGALNDAGVVLTGEGDAFVVAIMSDANYDSDYFTDNEQLIVDLATALGEERDALLKSQDGLSDTVTTGV